MRYLILVAALILAFALIGCAYVQNPTTPRIGAAISDNVTSATVQLQSVGECEFVATHCHKLDGTTTGSVTVKLTKTAANNFLVGALSAAGGMLAGKVLP